MSILFCEAMAEDCPHGEGKIKLRPAYRESKRVLAAQIPCAGLPRPVVVFVSVATVLLPLYAHND